MVGGEYELHVVEAGFSSGVTVILGKEVGPTLNFRFVEGTWNGASFEVAGRETATANNVLRSLKHCATKRTTKIAVLDYLMVDSTKHYVLSIVIKALKNSTMGNMCLLRK